MPIWKPIKVRLWRTLALWMVVACASLRCEATEPTESEHRSGPHGVEGWTLLDPLDDDPPGEQFAWTLVLARHEHVVRRIDGDPLIWKWRFWADGRQVAYQTGSLHFNMTCVLVDVRTGRKVAKYDCYHKKPRTLNWVRALEKQ